MKPTFWYKLFRFSELYCSVDIVTFFRSNYDGVLSMDFKADIFYRNYGLEKW